MSNAYEINGGREEGELREHDRENNISVCVSHFKLSAPHFHEAGTTFDFDTGDCF